MLLFEPDIHLVLAACYLDTPDVQDAQAALHNIRPEKFAVDGEFRDFDFTGK